MAVLSKCVLYIKIIADMYYVYIFPDVVFMMVIHTKLIIQYLKGSNDLSSHHLTRHCPARYALVLQASSNFKAWNNRGKSMVLSGIHWRSIEFLNNLLGT